MTYKEIKNELENIYRERDRVFGEAEIGQPVGCPKCRAWGVGNFEII